MKSHKPQEMVALEKIFHVPARLRIMSILMVNRSMGFNELIHILNLTRGNLSMHMKTLSNNRYININKKFKNNKSFTTYKITAKGKDGLQKYVAMLESIIASIKTGEV